MMILTKLCSERSNHFSDILNYASIYQKDLKISGKDGKFVKTSSLLFALFSDVFKKAYEITIEPSVINLIDFDILIIKLLVELLSHGQTSEASNCDLNQLSELLRTLNIHIKYDVIEAKIVSSSPKIKNWEVKDDDDDDDDTSQNYHELQEEVEEKVPEENESDSDYKPSNGDYESSEEEEEEEGDEEMSDNDEESKSNTLPWLKLRKCPICKELIEAQQFKSHFQIDHKPDFNKFKVHQQYALNQFKCISCNILFENLRNCIDHIKSKLDHPGYNEAKNEALKQKKIAGISLWDCDQCSSSNMTMKELKEHNTLNHPNIKPFYCHHCDKRYGRGTNLVMHIELVHNDPVNNPTRTRLCKLCNIRFDNLIEFRVHRKEFHPIIKRKVTPERCTCEICGKTVANSFTLKHHMMRHTNQKDYVCDLCGQKFIYPQALDRHKINQHEDPGVKCSVCKKKFPTMYEMTRHKKEHVKELAESEHICSYCGNKFYTKKNLNMHIKKNHEMKNKKSYQCKVCKKVASTISGLERHLIYHHSNESPYVCEVCKMTGRNFMYVRRHVDATHSGEEVSKQRVLYRPTQQLKQFLKDNVVEYKEIILPKY